MSAKNNTPDEPTVDEAKFEALKAELETALQAKAEAEKKAEEAEQAKAEAEQKAEEAAKSKPGKAKAVKTSIVNVVSNTDYSYLIEGVLVTPDAPKKLERREGNLLDCQIKAGLIVEYEG